MNRQMPNDGSTRQVEEIDLTPEDETALDRAWDGVTDEDIAASIAWLDAVDKERAGDE